MKKVRHLNGSSNHADHNRSSISTSSSSSPTSSPINPSKWQYQLPEVIMELIRSMLCGRDLLLRYELVCRLWSFSSRQFGSLSSLRIGEWEKYPCPMDIMSYRPVRLLYPRLSTSLRSLTIHSATQSTDFDELVVTLFPHLRHLTLRYQKDVDFDEHRDLSDKLIPLSSLVSFSSLTILSSEPMRFDLPSISALTHLGMLHLDCLCNEYGMEPINWSLPLLAAMYINDSNSHSLILDPNNYDAHSEMKWCSKHLNRLHINLAMTLAQWRHLLTISSSIQSLSLTIHMDPMDKDCKQLLPLIHHSAPSLQSLKVILKLAHAQTIFSYLSSWSSLNHLTIALDYCDVEASWLLDTCYLDQLTTLTRLISLNCVRSHDDHAYIWRSKLFDKKWPFTKVIPFLPSLVEVNGLSP
jgi:hypothetical protein